MALSKIQAEFVVDYCKLIAWMNAHGYRVRDGEAYRTEYQQKEYVRTGRSKTMLSRHRDRLARDFEIDIEFPDGSIVWFGNLTLDQAYNALKPAGEYWESLHPGNVWGGNFDLDLKTKDAWLDLGHFEKRV